MTRREPRHADDASGEDEEQAVIRHESATADRPATTMSAAPEGAYLRYFAKVEPSNGLGDEYCILPMGLRHCGAQSHAARGRRYG